VLLIDGEEKDVKTVTLAPKEFEAISFEVFEDAPGIHEVEVGQRTASFRVLAIPTEPAIDEPTPAPAPAPSPSQDSIPISAYQLVQQYTANEVAADSQYKGKLLQVSGKVPKIGNVGDTPCVSLSGSFDTDTNQQQSDPVFGEVVLCWFENESELVSLSQRQTITVQGICDGRAFSSIGTVDLESCHIVKY